MLMIFFKVVSVIRATYRALRAAVGIALVAHGTYKWVQKKRGTGC